MFFIIESIIYWLIDGGFSGLVDQLEDRLLCKQEVASSNLAQSTISDFLCSTVCFKYSYFVL